MRQRALVRRMDVHPGVCREFTLLTAKMIGPISRFLCSALVIALFVFDANAQSSNSSAFVGRVLDPSNAAIAGAHITAIPLGRTSGLSTVSDQAGQFTLPLES